MYTKERPGTPRGLGAQPPWVGLIVDPPGVGGGANRLRNYILHKPMHTHYNE
jgi:hypothetical protein